jgi:hypothetical protein
MILDGMDIVNIQGMFWQALQIIRLPGRSIFRFIDRIVN